MVQLSRNNEESSFSDLIATIQNCGFDRLIGGRHGQHPVIRNLDLAPPSVFRECAFYSEQLMPHTTEHLIIYNMRLA